MLQSNKLAHRDIHNNGIGRMFAIAFTHRTTWASSIHLFVTAIRDFFIPQFLTKYRIKRTPVVSVDHPLDETIPFIPAYIDIYLHFVPLWVKSLYFIYREFGKPSLPAIKSFTRDLTALYREAGCIYRQCQSTTNRPQYLKNPAFKLIHAVDPHLHCIPSLHVLIVVYNAMRIPQLIEQFNKQGFDYTAQKDYVFDQAVKIVESILFVKQHSVNCIPAALFAMSNLHPTYDEQQALHLVECMFTRLGSNLETRQQIRDSLRNQYLSFMRTHKDCGGDYKDVLVRYLLTSVNAEIHSTQ